MRPSRVTFPSGLRCRSSRPSLRPDHPSAPVEERAATLELARAAGLDATKRVLDVGCGVGGTSRCLAREFGCRVTGIDLTDDYCRAAAMLTARIGLAHLADYRQGDATDLPFDDRQFDVV